MTFGGLILAGGRSRRMGQCKATLTVRGETLLEHTVRQLAGFPELWLSANDSELAKGLPVRLVTDRFPGAGPLAGLEAALSASGCDALVCVPCDLPNLTPAVPRLLTERFSPEQDALVLSDSTGRLHPLCGVYHRRALPVIRRQLERGERRVSDLLPHLRWACLSREIPDRVLYNLNTPEDLLRLGSGGTDMDRRRGLL